MDVKIRRCVVKAKAGWCAVCGDYVWLAEEGGCVKGHPASGISGTYEAEYAPEDRLEEALRSAEQAAARVGEVAKETWDEATPAVKRAWAEARPAMRRAGEAAGRAVDELGESIRTFSSAMAEKRDTDAPPPPAADEPDRDD